MKGYDEHGTILLPPRIPGEKLPSELVEHYEELKKTAEEEEKAKAEAAAAAEEASPGKHLQSTSIINISAISTNQPISKIHKSKRSTHT